jgi:hypothetical protein
MSLPQTSTEEEQYDLELERNDLRRSTDRAAGLYNNLLTGPGRWRAFLESSHQDLFKRWPEIHDAIIDARRWENPIHFNGTFAEKVARAKPLPAVSTVGQMERIILRALAMLNMDQPTRERLIRAAYDAERAEYKAMEESAAAKSKLGPGEVDLSSIEF